MRLPDRAPNVPNSGCRNQTRNQHREGRARQGQLWLLLSRPAILRLQLPAFAALLRQRPRLAQVGLPPSQLGTCTQRWLQVAGCGPLRLPRPRAPGRPQCSVLGHRASRAPLPIPGDSPALAALGRRQERRRKALRPEGRKSREGGGYL